MKRWILPVVGLTAMTLQADDFKLLDGTEYKGASLIRVDPDGLVIVTDSGLTKLKFTELPPETQKEYGYDAADPQAFSRTMESAEEVFARQEKQRQIRAQRWSNNWWAVSSIRATGWPAHLKVIQVLKDGLLASGNVEDRDGKLSPIDEAFISCNPSDTVAGDSIDITLYPIGVKTYQAATGALKTVHGFVSSENDARRLLLAEPH